jgi:hypothetical protein
MFFCIVSRSIEPEGASYEERGRGARVSITGVALLLRCWFSRDAFGDHVGEHRA